MRNTNDDLTAAISRAIATVSVPRDICVTNTEVRVKVISSARTISNVR